MRNLAALAGSPWGRLAVLTVSTWVFVVNSGGSCYPSRIDLGLADFSSPTSYFRYSFRVDNLLPSDELSLQFPVNFQVSPPVNPLLGLIFRNSTPVDCWRVLGETSQRGFVDRNWNGQRDATDDTFDFSSTTNSLQFNFATRDFGFGDYTFQATEQYLFIPTRDHRYNIGARWLGSSGTQGAAEDLQLSLVVLHNASILPHIAFGRSDVTAKAGAPLTINTTISISNPNGSENLARLDFFTQTGEPLDVRLAGRTATSHSIVVGPHATESATIDSTGQPLTTGWAVAQSLLKSEFSTVYETFRLGGTAAVSAPQGEAATPVGSAGIAASGVSLVYDLGVRKGDGKDTAIAIANPANSEATFQMTLLDANDAPIATSQPLSLPSEHQMAKFFEQYFEGATVAGLLPSLPFAGTVRIRSNTDIAVTTLQTLDGFQTASLPAGSLRSN